MAAMREFHLALTQVGLENLFSYEETLSHPNNFRLFFSNI